MATTDFQDKQLSSLIAHRLVQFREGAGLDIPDMVKRTRISRSGLNKMENPAKSNPTISYLWRYLRACDRTLFEFFDYDPWLPPRNEKVKRDNAIRKAERILKNPEKADNFRSVLEWMSD